MAKQIPLTRDFYAVVDDDDYEALAAFRWQAFVPRGQRRARVYATRCVRENGRSCTIYMHRVIAAAPKGSTVDHANGDGLDNRRHNLRICTVSDNAKNKLSHGSTGYKGVVVARSGRYVARIKIDGKVKHLGTHDTPQLAAEAYDRGAEQHFGAFALTNRQQAEITTPPLSPKGSGAVSPGGWPLPLHRSSRRDTPTC